MTASRGIHGLDGVGKEAPASSGSPRRCVRCGDRCLPRKFYCEPCRVTAHKEVNRRYHNSPSGKIVAWKWWDRNRERILIYRKRAYAKRYTGLKTCATWGCTNTFDNHKPRSRQKFCDDCARLFRSRAPYSRVGVARWPKKAA